MDDKSIFPDKELIPGEEDLKTHLGKNFRLWFEIQDFVLQKYPDAISEWNFPGKKYGWSFRMKDKKRAIIYFLPRSGYFKVAFVFGQKAFDFIMDSDIPEEIKNELAAARKYAEGRGIRIDIRDHKDLKEIKKLVEIKLAF